MATQSLLQLRFEGKSVQDGRILWNDLSQFVSNIDSAIQRIINVLERGTSIRIGRPTRAFQALTALEIVTLAKGSFELGLSLRREQDLLPGFDIGEQAFVKLTDGLGTIAEDGEDMPLPEGFDQGVLTALREAGRILDRDIDIIHISPAVHLPSQKAVYDRPTRERIVSRIRRIEQTWAVAEGRLLMADVKEGSLRCRLNPSVGAPVYCDFEEEMTPIIVGNLRRFVALRGEANIDPLTNKILSLFIRDLEPIETPPVVGISRPSPSAFWQAKGFDELAMEQEVYPLKDWQQLMGRWPEDADFDSFLEAIQSARDIDYPR